MDTKNNDKEYWNKLAWAYNNMFQNRKIYKKLYSLINESLNKDMDVLEIGTGSGMIAREISDNVKTVLATDIAEKMIEKAKKNSHLENITFEVQDSKNLKAADSSFDAVIISNVLHIISNPQKTLDEIKRVLKKDGILIAPTFMWNEKTFIGKIEQFFMLRKGFPIHSRWNTKEYLGFLEEQGFHVVKQKTIPTHFSLCYVECKK